MLNGLQSPCSLYLFEGVNFQDYSRRGESLVLSAEGVSIYVIFGSGESSILSLGEVGLRHYLAEGS